MVARRFSVLLGRQFSPVEGNLSQLRCASTAATTSSANADGDATAKKKSRTGLWLAAVAGAAGIGVFAYPQLVNGPSVVPSSLPPHADPPVAAKVSPAAATVVEPPKPKLLTPREELDLHISSLKNELAELRKQKRSKLVDMKKRSIKDEIKIIESGIKKLEKA